MLKANKCQTFLLIGIIAISDKWHSALYISETYNI